MQSQNVSICQKTPKQVRITFFGDSVCVGQGVSIFKGWIPMIARDLDKMEQLLGCEIVVTNNSVNGRTTRQALEDMPYTMQTNEPEIVIVQFGLNDCNYWVTDRGVPRVSKAAFRANLLEIIERSNRFGARAVVLNSNHPTMRDKESLPHTSITFEQSNRAYNQEIRDIAKQLGNGVVFRDIETAFLSQVTEDKTLDRFLLADGLHLSAAGHQLYYELVGPTLLRLVKETTQGSAKNAIPALK